MLPVITIVGRPNVGKSTLFNRLTRSRDALVADQPGLTRDRQYGVGKIGPHSYVVVDTGGLGGTNAGVDPLIERQVKLAMEEADHILFLVDAREGCTGGDELVAEELRRTGKAITLVANKIDHMDPALATVEFHALGLGDPMPIAAAQGHGMRRLMAQVLTGLPEETPDSTSTTDSCGIKIAVVGRPNVGKSTLINRLLGEERVVAFDQPGTTRDSIFIPLQHDNRDYTVIDTAGMRRRARVRDAIEKFSVIKTLQAMEQANVVCLVLDAHQGLGEQDATLAGHILESGRAVVVAVNKWDGLEASKRDQVRTEIQRKLPFLDFACFHFISALHGSGVGVLLEAVDHAYTNATRKLSTPQLTRILEAAAQEHQPPRVRGRRIKLRYAHQGGLNPPIIVIHGNQTEALPNTYQRYLVNRFRRALEVDGTPIRLQFKSGENPFHRKRTRLTPRQVRKRKRLLKFVSRKK